MPPRIASVVLALAASLLTTACTGDNRTLAAAAVSAGPTASAVPGVDLPDGALRSLVPSPSEVPAGMVPVLQGSGPRDVAALAAFSAEPKQAAAALREHGFTDGYAVQYASPTDPRVLSVVATRFGDAAGAQADLEGDLAVPGGEVVHTDPVGEVSELRRQPMPAGGSVELVMLRFRSGATTWLVAWSEPAPADVQVPLRLGQLVAARS